jgi:hypothetical protein
MTERRLAWIYRSAVGGFHFRPRRLMDMARRIRSISDASAALQSLSYSLRVIRDIH